MEPGNAVKSAPLHKLIGDVRLVVRGTPEPSDEQFEAHIADALAMAGSVRVVLVMYESSARISPKHRAWLVRSGLFDVPHAVLTDALVARAEIDAVAALGACIRSFPRSEFEQACDFLAIPACSRTELLHGSAMMKEQMAIDVSLGVGALRSDE
jgi:hypothetical protein